ncbi:MAG: SDR family NAD(P)-dependent oxidoreductase [Bacilli bacterium]
MKKIVFITGSTSDLGQKIAEIFSKNNYDLILTYHNNKNNCAKLKNKLEKKYKNNIFIEYLDIKEENLITEVVNKYKKIDILVNNAAYTNDCDIFEKDSKEFKKVLETNILGTFNLTKAVAKKMLKNKSGSIINISSTNSIDTNYPESIDYDASKAAINSMTRNFADYLAPYIRVNAILPGWIDTNINKNLNPNFKKEEENKILLKRFAKPEEIANTIYNVATDTYINKTLIRVDGGYNG